MVLFSSPLQIPCTNEQFARPFSCLSVASADRTTSIALSRVRTEILSNISLVLVSVMPSTIPSQNSTFDLRPTYVAVQDRSGALIDALKASFPSSGIISWALAPEEVQYSSDQVSQHISKDINVQHWEQVDDNVTLSTIKELGEMFLKEKVNFIKPEKLTQEVCNDFIQFVNFEKERRDMLYNKTTGQGNNELWMLHRAGRTTASKVCKICHLIEYTDP